MNILQQMQKALTASIKSYLRTYVFEANVPIHIKEFIKTIHADVSKCKNALALRNYLLGVIENSSSFWRKLTPFTTYNRLLTQLEEVVNNPQFSAQNILLAQNTELHQHYIQQQNNLFKPLHEEITHLKDTNKILTRSVAELKKENKRLHIENEYLMQEMQQMFSNIAGKLNNIE
ncbi:MAG: hypothetical protein M3R00_10020, partial [Pseudomonadota bacterium]|nr:hypothetical protein [Pseudomonadota bacterium]